MKVATLLLPIFILSCTLCHAQDEVPPKTKFDEFISRKGGYVKTEDYILPRLILRLSYGETRIRKVFIESEVKVFYQVASGDFVGSVLSTDFPALLSAFESLKGQLKTDSKTPADILENKYIDPDGMELGYVVDGKNVTWFIKPYRLCPRTLFIKDPYSLEDSFKQASAKLGELK